MKHTKLYDIFQKIEDHTLDTLIFRLPDFISNENISNFKKLNLNIPETSAYFSTGKYRFDIPIDIEFDVIFSREKPADYKSLTSVLKWVNVRADSEINILPNGYGGLCLIDFPDGKPEEMIKKLLEFEEDGFGKENDVLYLTTQDMMDKILENL